MEEHVAGLLGFELIELPTSAAADPAAAISHLLGWLAEQGCIPTPLVHSLTEQLLEAEQLSPRVIGQGVAFPHLRHEHVTGQRGIIGRSPHGMVWAGSTEVIRLVCMIITPPDRPGDYLRLLARAVTAFRTAAA